MVIKKNFSKRPLTLAFDKVYRNKIYSFNFINAKKKPGSSKPESSQGKQPKSKPTQKLLEPQKASREELIVWLKERSNIAEDRLIAPEKLARIPKIAQVRRRRGAVYKNEPVFLKLLEALIECKRTGKKISLEGVRKFLMATPRADLETYLAAYGITGAEFTYLLSQNLAVN